MAGSRGEQFPVQPRSEVGRHTGHGVAEAPASIQAGGGRLEGNEQANVIHAGQPPLGPRSEPLGNGRRALVVPRGQGPPRGSAREVSLGEAEGESAYRPPGRVAQVNPPADWLDKMNAKIEELVQWKEYGTHAIAPKISLTPPFTPNIMDEPLPPNFKAPNIRRYDGTGDPQEHILTYQAAMMLMGSSDALMCRAFFSTLSGGAQRWFTSLKGSSLNSFQDLATKFITHFMRGRKCKKHFTHLASVKQGRDETLTEFLSRWRKEEAEVEDMDDHSAMAMFIAALCAGDLYKSLRRKTPGSYAALMRKVDRYAEAEEANHLKCLEEEGSKRQRMEEPPKSKRGRFILPEAAQKDQWPRTHCGKGSGEVGDTR